MNPVPKTRKKVSIGYWLSLVVICLALFPITAYMLYGLHCLRIDNRSKQTLRTLIPIAFKEANISPGEPMPKGSTRDGLEVIEVYTENGGNGRRILISWPPEVNLIAEDRQVWAIDINPPSGMDWEIKNVSAEAFGFDEWPDTDALPERQAFSGIDLDSFWFQYGYISGIDGQLILPAGTRLADP